MEANIKCTFVVAALALMIAVPGMRVSAAPIIIPELTSST